MKGLFPLGCCFFILLIGVAQKGFSQGLWKVRQLSFDPKNHELDHNENFSPDDKWIVYDTRPDPAGIALNAEIEKISVKDGKIVTLYRVKHPNAHGPGVGAVSYHPFKNQVVFIHGISNAAPYAGHRRTGVMIDEAFLGKPFNIDSRDIYPPFTAGALRGGTHRHQWSSDGNWIGFTYNDAIMVALEKDSGMVFDLRTVGVAKRQGPSLKIKEDIDGENVQGAWFSALVVEVVPDPLPGSNAIKKAYGDWWVGNNGYKMAGGDWQRARAFMGDLVTEKGEEITEVFIVDIPDSIEIPSERGPLEGTETRMPLPPQGAVTRRLTYTEGRKYPGIATVPRHWLSSSVDGQHISYLAKDEQGIVQVFFVSPLGGNPIQASFHASSVQSMVRWHPRKREFTYICDNSIFRNEIDKNGKVGSPVRITESFPDAPFAHCYSRNGQQLAFNRLVGTGDKKFIQIFLADRP